MRSLSEEPVNRLMTEPVLSIDLHDPPSEIFRLLGQYKVHHLPVVDRGRLVGMLSTADVMKLELLVPHTPEARNAFVDSRLKVEQLMRTHVPCAGASTSVEEAARIMVEHGVHALPVVAPDGQLLGIITTTDIMHAGLRVHGEHEGGADDADAVAQLEDAARRCTQAAERLRRLERVRLAAERYMRVGQDEQLHSELTRALRATEAG